MFFRARSSEMVVKVEAQSPAMVVRGSSFGRHRAPDTLRVVLVCARDLPVMDKTGFADPYAMLVCSHGLTRVRRKSSTIPQTLSPVWNEPFIFEKTPPDAKLTIDLWDQDTLNSDFIGKVTIHVSELPPTGEPLARWLPLSRGEVRVEISYRSANAMQVQAALALSPPLPPPSSLEVLCCTWNVGNALPPSAKELGHEWLRGGDAGLIAVGTQECSFKVVPGGLSSASFWLQRVQDAIGEEFAMVACCSLGQMHLALLCRKQLLGLLSRVETQGEATGLGHVLGNKGGLAISCELASRSLCFISAHLAAHQDEAERRASDFVEINRGVTLRKAEREVDLVNRFDLLVWMGDLNYRLDLGREEVLAAVRRRDWALLQGNDQLLKERGRGTAFAGFEEGALTFPPTFKHQHGEGPVAVPGGEPQREYETKKARVPSWCDRVLWREWPGLPAAQLLEYRSVPAVCTSDHSPVKARLSISLPAPVPPAGAHPPELREQFTLVVSGLSCSDLLPSGDIGGFSDPYVRFQLADFSSTPTCSAVRRKTLNPSWAEAILVHMPWAYATPEAVRGAHLMVSVMDKDTFSADDALGHCVISLHGDWPLRVKSPITRRGSVSGELRMVVHLRRRVIGDLRGDWGLGAILNSA